MIADLAAVVWKKIPFRLRRTIVRATQASFTVSAAVIITGPDGKVLLLDHIIRPNSGWGLPGGFLEHGEQPEAGIKREIDEETGLQLFDLKMIRVRTFGSHIEMIFRARTSGEPNIDAREIKGFGWFGYGELPAEMNPAQMHLIETVLEEEDQKNGKFEKKVGSD